MADKSAIEWTDATWNPIRARNKTTGKVGWFCTHVSEGCRNCYAETWNMRLGTALAYKPGHLNDVEIFLDRKMLEAPLRWKRPRHIFTLSMSDLFGEFIADEWLREIFDVIVRTPHHTYQVLTKREERMFDQMHAMWDVPPPNVWLGVSVEDQANADRRIPYLLETPAAKRFLSCEPLLGPIDLRGICRDTLGVALDALTGLHVSDDGGILMRTRKPWINWVIVGGESGPDARPMHPDWLRSLRDQCVPAGASFFFKQWGEYAPTPEFRDGEPFMSRVGKRKAGRMLDGVEHNEFPSEVAR